MLVHIVFLGGTAVSAKWTDFELAQLNLKIWGWWLLEYLAVMIPEVLGLT